MERLFSTNISIDNKNVVYGVFSDQGKYVFLPEANDPEFKGFSFQHQNGQWQDLELIAPELKKQAMDALDKYLLTQH